MGRAPLVLAALLVCVVYQTAGIIAQTAAPEGWVVLPVEEYRALREKALPPAPLPATPPIVGRATDPSGAVLPGVTVVVELGAARLTAITGGDGTFLMTDVPSGSVRLTAQLTGFATQSRSVVFEQKPLQVEFVLPVGAVTETITVTGETAPPSPEPSQNVINLQQRAAGVLPIPVDVPRAGTSHQFVKPLVVDQEAVVMLRYKRK